MKKSVLILGDNFFYGQNLTTKLIECSKLKKGAKILLYKTQNPELFGVAKISKKKNKVIKLIEKPKNYISNYAITGLYFFDNKVVELAKKLRPSSRGELEIVDLLKKYQKLNQLEAELLGRGGAWLDTGNLDNYFKTSSFVQAIQNNKV